MPTMTAARDEVFGLFKTYWDANAKYPLVTGTIPEIRYEGTVKPDKPASDACWCRISMVHMAGSQLTFGKLGGRRFERRGTIYVQIFVPVKGGEGLSASEALGIVARDAFEGKSTASGVWFRDVHVEDLGIDGSWEATNVLASFSYDEIK